MTGSRWAGITLPVDSERLVGSVKHHVRHLVVVTAHADWPAHLEEGQDLAAHLVRAVEEQGEDGRLPIKVTARRSVRRCAVRRPGVRRSTVHAAGGRR